MSMTVNNLNNLFSGVFGWNNNNNNSSSSLFGSTSNYGVNLTDYATIKSGSYRKLLKAYYAAYPEETKKTQNSTKTVSSTQTKKEQTKAFARIEDSADTVKDAADALLTQGNKSVFAKVEKTDDKGNKTTEYDTDAIYKAVDKFVSGYNTMIDRAQDSTKNSIKNVADSTVRYTQSNSKALESIGITIDSDNKLSLDKEEFEKADMDTVKSMFNKTGSYGYQISAKASMISFYAERAASQSVMYGEDGTYNYTYQSGNLYNTGI